MCLVFHLLYADVPEVMPALIHLLKDVLETVSIIGASRRSIPSLQTVGKIKWAISLHHRVQLWQAFISQGRCVVFHLTEKLCGISIMWCVRLFTVSGKIPSPSELMDLLLKV